MAVTTKVKLCGTTRLEDAELAVELGAWAIGFILWPHSKRHVDPGLAAGIAGAVRRRIDTVGVFVNQPLDDVEAAADAIGLTHVQLHGDEGPAFCAEAGRRTGCKVIKAARVRSGADIQGLASFHTDFHLLDSFLRGVPGGTGETFSWEIARGHRGSIPVILSGGLNPDNVAEAISVVNPFAVDVASGVERGPGRKDPDKLKAFGAAVAATAQAPLNAR